MVKREADVKMQKIAQRFDKRGREAYSRSVIAELEREERRRHLQEQMRLQDIQKEVLREEQLIARLMRQSQQEKRIAVQLMQIRQQKEVLRQNRILRERQIQEQRLRDFQQALDREAALLQQDRINREAELCKERELHQRLAAERAHAKHLKHFNICRGILEQIVDLATKAGEYRLLTAK
ncbi:sperm flagellar protein 2 [Clarias magur]|uniref:Sperm flagellar protein 2 n=1 Tax=Clarias magur TaxID=1594786 RepID=A0A8J4WSQ8_CLAMG|nr:sperm flagellar protein 2 [Clarias magur]